MPYLVRENLFIGNINDSATILRQGSGEITHILSVLSSASISFFSEWRSGLLIPTKEIRKVYVGSSGSDVDPGDSLGTSQSSEKLLYLLEYAGKDLKLVRMAVPLRDMERENMLDYLDVCLDFIHESRKQGSVLVHCFAGVSRSAAIITAYLMRTKQLSLEDALSSLRQICESVCPNDGFLDRVIVIQGLLFQLTSLCCPMILNLKMFEDMGFKVDHGSPIYKRFHLTLLGDSYNRGERVDSSKFGADPGLPTEEPSSETGTSINKAFISTPAYRCKKCRRVVALQRNVVYHTPGEGEASFAWSKRRGGNPFNKNDEFECSSLFVEPLRWMKTVEEGGLEGKLSYVHCEARLGYFNWSGIQCNCGSWVTPAFQLHKSGVDISTV